MRVELAHVISAVLIGIGATLLMDIWNALLRRTIRVPSLDYCLLGRWIRHMPATFRHANIAASPSRSGECAAGWLAHYSIGITLAAGFVLLSPGGWLDRPTLIPALSYGIATVIFPFFILQPALGLGIASSRAARPVQARMKSLGTHVVFGVGLYLVALALSHVGLPAGLLPP